MNIDAQTFLDTVFQDLGPDEHICVTRATPKEAPATGMWFNNCTPEARQWRKWDASKRAQAWYFCVSTISGEQNDKRTMVGRGRKHLVNAFCLVLDDIGTKAVTPAVEPSWKLESSPGNFQWGYLLDCTQDFDRYEALLEYCHQQGWGDQGAGGSYRVMRVPGSANLKPGRQKFKSVITEWNLTVWSLDELAADLGCDFSKINVEERHAVSQKSGGAVALDGIDPLLDWLVDHSDVVRDVGGEWVDLLCPWADAHTTGENTAGYSPLGRGAGDWVQTRAFKCQHEHCKDRNLRSLVDWAVELGGPAVSGYDPLPWLQQRYVYIETGQLVADVVQRPVGGIWTWEFADWSKKHPGRVRMPGRDKPIGGTLYRPIPRGADVGLIEAFGQSYVNTYVPPNWAETDERPEVFLEHIDYLVPDEVERDIFLNWLAYKIQKPASRSYAVVMVAEDAYGTGRSWLRDMLSKVLQGGVNAASLAQLIGKGTSAEQTYNNWMICQFIVVEEAKDSGLTRDDFYHGYETFKLFVDTKVMEGVRINPKFGRTRYENVYFNALIFSNHADAMVLPETDRRIFVVENPSERLDYAYYDRLTGALSTQEPSRVYWWLMRRDVSRYDHIYPPMTPAKARMIEDTRAPSDAVMGWLRENHGPDLVTKVTLKVAVVLAARDLDLEKTMREPSTVTKLLWRKMKNLRDDDPKNGARYLLDGKQTEVRALRNRQQWVISDHERDNSAVVDNMNLAKVRLTAV